jgi:hypothetical protein
MRDDVIEVAGPVEDYDYAYSADEDGEDGNGTVTFVFTDDMALAAGRITYPNPALAATAQDTDRYSITAVNAETAIRALVNTNAGPGALTARRVPGLVLGAAAGVGTNVTTSTRFEPLMDVCRSIATAGGGLGFRTKQVGLTVEFEVFAPRDLTTSMRVGRQLHNLATVRYNPSAPLTTVAIVGGQAAGAARVIRERPNTAALAAGHPRLETFVDRRDVDNTADLDTAGDGALVDGEASIRLSIEAIDTASQTYRTDYGPGDIVSTAVFDGVTVEQVIQQVEIDYTPDSGEEITLVIGTQDAIYGSAAAFLQAQILRRQQQAAAAGEIPV